MTAPITDHAYRPDRAGQWHTGRCDKCGEPKGAHLHMTPDVAHCNGCAADRLAGETA